MKRVILQHWDGPATDLERASWASIGAYASRIGAEHTVLTGKPMGELAFPHMHKLHLFSACFDSYDTVVMMDSDMFTSGLLERSIFDVTGIGIFGPLQIAIRKTLHGRIPAPFARKAMGDYYGGALYKFERAQRLSFRRHMTAQLLRAFDSYELGCDEGVIHYLACATGTTGMGLPDGERWACSSFDPDVANAHLVHVRRRVTAGREERRPKTEALRALQLAGVVQL